MPVRATTTADHAVRRLVTSDYFLFDEVRPSATWEVGGDDGCHFLAVLSGSIALDPRWAMPPLTAGGCVLLPASIGSQSLAVTATGAGPARLLHVTLP